MLVHGSESRESVIDQRYRLDLLEHRFQRVQEVRGIHGGKWTFACPFCAHTGKTEAKRHERKAALLWNGVQNSWVFTCAKGGSGVCNGRGMTLERLLEALDPRVAERYRWERWQAGTTGKGHNCPGPRGLKSLAVSEGVGTG